MGMRLPALLLACLLFALMGCAEHGGFHFTSPPLHGWQHEDSTQESVPPDEDSGCLVVYNGVDLDHDGVDDILDQCPNTPPGVVVNGMGCAAETIPDATVYFSSGETEYSGNFMESLNSMGAFLSEHPDAVVHIAGHTDDVGDAAFNMRLSKRRAESLKQYLMHSWNIASDRILVAAHGETAPVADNATPQGRAENRRACLSIGPPWETLADEDAITETLAPSSLFRARMHFASGAVTPDTVDADALERIAAYLLHNPSAVALIEGHADATGNAYMNMLLSKERAEKVRWLLHEGFNIPLERMRVLAHGESAPLAENTNAPGRRMNRRVDVLCGPTESIPWNSALLL